MELYLAVLRFKSRFAAVVGGVGSAAVADFGTQAPSSFVQLRRDYGQCLRHYENVTHPAQPIAPAGLRHAGDSPYMPSKCPL